MGHVMRIETWDIVLAREIAAAEHLTFQWGHHDCAVWTFDVIAKLQGRESLADQWRGAYSSRVGASRTMRLLGWSSLADAAGKLLGVVSQPAAFAARGSLVLIQNGKIQALGVCIGNSSAFLAPAGLEIRPTEACSYSWVV